MRIAHYILIFLALNCWHANVYAQVLGNDNTARLTKEQMQSFREQAIRSVTDLGQLIKAIANKQNKMEKRSNAVGLALELFQSDSVTVEVSSLRSKVNKQYTIRAYLNKLRLLPYKSVKIEWYRIYLCNEFIMSPNGDYYGTATFLQRFEGQGNTEMGPYIDITRRRIQIILKKQDAYDGTDRVRVYVLKLGDIKVEETSNE